MARGSASSTVTAQPRACAEEAISRPITPAPMHSTDRALPSRARIARASSSVRRYSARSPPCTGRCRAAPPVVSSSLSYRSSRPSARRTRCASGSTASTGVPSTSSTAEFGVAALGVEIQHRRFGVLGQHRFRQRRPFIWPPGLVADQQDAAVEAGLTHGDRGPAAGLAGADDDVRRGHASPAYRLLGGDAARRRLRRQPGVGPRRISWPVNFTSVCPGPRACDDADRGRVVDQPAIRRPGRLAAHGRGMPPQIVLGAADHRTGVQPRPRRRRCRHIRHLRLWRLLRQHAAVVDGRRRLGARSRRQRQHSGTATPSRQRHDRRISPPAPNRAASMERRRAGFKQFRPSMGRGPAPRNHVPRPDRAAT